MSPRTLMRDLLPLTAMMILKRAILPTSRRLTTPAQQVHEQFLYSLVTPCKRCIRIHRILPCTIFQQHYSTYATTSNLRDHLPHFHHRICDIGADWGHFWDARALWSLIGIKLNIIAGRSADYIACPKQQDRARSFNIGIPADILILYGGVLWLGMPREELVVLFFFAKLRATKVLDIFLVDSAPF